MPTGSDERIWHRLATQTPSHNPGGDSCRGGGAQAKIAANFETAQEHPAATTGDPRGKVMPR